jgi:hypothetical protein
VYASAALYQSAQSPRVVSVVVTADSYLCINHLVPGIGLVTVMFLNENVSSRPVPGAPSLPVLHQQSA